MFEYIVKLILDKEGMLHNLSTGKVELIDGYLQDDLIMEYFLKSYLRKSENSKNNEEVIAPRLWLSQFFLDEMNVIYNQSTRKTFEEAKKHSIPRLDLPIQLVVVSSEFDESVDLHIAGVGRVRLTEKQRKRLIKQLENPIKSVFDDTEESPRFIYYEKEIKEKNSIRYEKELKYQDLFKQFGAD